MNSFPDTLEELKAQAHDLSGRELRFLPDGEVVMVEGWPTEVSTWQTTSGRPWAEFVLRTLTGQAIRCVAFPSVYAAARHGFCDNERPRVVLGRVSNCEAGPSLHVISWERPSFRPRHA